MYENIAKKRLLKSILISALAIVFFAWISFQSLQQQQMLGTPELWSGYSLFAIILLLALFNLRKRLSQLPLLCSAYTWHQIHLIFGLVSIPLYLLHVEYWWPPFGYELLLSLSYYMAILSGLLGLLIQYYYPRRLTEVGNEMIFQRIPDAIAEIREQAMLEVEQCVQETRSETLLSLYADSLDHYFRRPRFLLPHWVGSQAAEFWIYKTIRPMHQFCSSQEMKSIQRIEQLALEKNRIDQQYAFQLVIKLWLFIHIPSVMALLVLVFWHLLLVNIYVL